MHAIKDFQFFSSYSVITCLCFLGGYYRMCSIMHESPRNSHGSYYFGVPGDLVKFIRSQRFILSFWLIFVFSGCLALHSLRGFIAVSDEVFFSGVDILKGFVAMFSIEILAAVHTQIPHSTEVSTLVERESAHTVKQDKYRNVFHEVRVPLNSIAMGIQLLGDSTIPRHSPDGEVVMMMKEAATFIGETLNDVLAFQMIEEKSLKLLYKPFTIGDLLTVGFESFAELGENKHIKIEKCVDPGTPLCVMGDVYRLKYATMKLISNAVKFGQPNFPIIVGVSASEARIETVQISEWACKQVETREYSISVTDTGSRMTARELQDAFAPIPVGCKSYAPKSHRRSGLGLTICRKIVSMHGGSISCDCESGSGTTFTIVLPLEVVVGEVDLSFSPIMYLLGDRVVKRSGAAARAAAVLLQSPRIGADHAERVDSEAEPLGQQGGSGNDIEVVTSPTAAQLNSPGKIPRAAVKAMLYLKVLIVDGKWLFL